MASNLIKFVFKHKFFEDDTISDGNNSQDDCTSTSIFVLGKLSDSKLMIHQSSTISLTNNKLIKDASPDFSHHLDSFTKSSCKHY